MASSAGRSQRPVTVIGGTGFIGRRLVERLLARNVPVRVVGRNATSSSLAERMTDSGIECVAGDITQAGAAERMTENSRAVVNLVGTTGAASELAFHALHCEAPARIAEAARAHCVDRLVHFSAMGVSATAPSIADRSKAAGEKAVRDAFPGAVIVRPSLVYGSGDHFVSRFAPMLRRAPVMPLIGGGRTRFEPMHVDDMAGAVAEILTADAEPGPEYDLGGPEAVSMRELLERLRDALGGDTLFVPVPFVLAELVVRCIERLPGAPITLDQVRLLETDKVSSPGTLRPADLGIVPQPISTYLSQLA